MGADDVDHCFGIGSLFERETKFFEVQKLGYIGQGVKVFLKLALRNEKEHDQIDRLVVQCLEVDSLSRATKCADNFLDQFGRCMRDADAESDSGAH